MTEVSLAWSKDSNASIYGRVPYSEIECMQADPEGTPPAPLPRDFLNARHAGKIAALEERRCGAQIQRRRLESHPRISPI